MKISCNNCGKFVDVPMVIRWDESFVERQGISTAKKYKIVDGYVGKSKICTIKENVKYRDFDCCFLNKEPVLHDTLDEAKAEAQRLLDEWMGGLWDG